MVLLRRYGPWYHFADKNPQIGQRDIQVKVDIPLANFANLDYCIPTNRHCLPVDVPSPAATGQFVLFQFMRPRIKVCGLTRPEDARLAREFGADFFGIVLYANSPRQVRAEALEVLLAAIPQGKRVAVDVAPAPGSLKKRRDQGFDFCQIHYDPAEIPDKTLEDWLQEVGPDRLWLAPRLPSGVDFPAAALRVAHTLVLDTYQKGAYGGTGRVGDWQHFKALSEKHPQHHWVLSGGLRPENIRAALRATSAKVVDVNSGVESAPGIKDTALLDLFFANLAGS